MDMSRAIQERCGEGEKPAEAVHGAAKDLSLDAEKWKHKIHLTSTSTIEAFG